MQAAATRPPAAQRQRRANNSGVIPHFVIADGAALLNALPIAAAIIERQDDGGLKVAAHNGRFRETVQLSTCNALNWDDADCLKNGPIGEVIQSFFDGRGPCRRTRLQGRRGRLGPLFPDEARAFARRQGLGSALPAQRRRPHRRGPGRTHAALRDASRQPDRTAQPPRLQRCDRESRRESRARPRTCGPGRGHAALLPDQREHGRARRGRIADHLCPAIDPRAAGRRCPRAHRRQRIRGSGFAAAGGRGCAEGGRADSAGDGRAVQAVGARDSRRMRDRRRADECRAGLRGAVPQRPVRGQAGESRGQAPGLRTQAGDRGASPLLDRDRASPGARQGPAQALLPAAHQPQDGRRRGLRGARALELTRIAAKSARPSSFPSRRNPD